MTAPPDDTTRAVIAALRAERDAAQAREATLAKELAARTAELAQRNNEYGERIDHQAATIDVLKAMSASPGDPQPVFDLIAQRARNLCNGAHVGLFEFDGALVHIRAWSGTYHAGIESRYPKLPTRETISGRAILEGRIIHIRDADADLDLLEAIREAGSRSILSVPLMRDSVTVGAISLNAPQRGGFSDGQVGLLKTFAEQAVIAISSAETYRALQARTADLQQSLEYQTATSDVLKVIGGSGFALEPVFQVVADTAVRLCRADQAVIYRLREGTFRWAAGTDMLPEYERIERAVAIRPGTGSLIGRVALQGRPVQILDAWTDPLYEVKDDARAGGIHTMLGVPLLLDGVTIGAIGLARLRIEPYTDRQIELVTTFATQAVIAMENARLITEQREALEQQTATAEVLQVINASPGNLVPVFDAMLEKAMRLCGAAFGALFISDGDVVRLVRSRNVPPDFKEYLELEAPRLDAPSLLSRAMREQTVLNVADLRETSPYHDRVSLSVAAVELGGIRSICWVPLIHETNALGLFAIFRQEVRPFSEKQMALLQNFAAQAVIAMENARLISEQREALEQQTATAEVLQVINASPGNLAPVFDALLEKAMRLCAANLGLLLTYDGESFHLAAECGVPAAFLEFRRKNATVEQHGGGAARVLETKRPFQTLDAREGEGYRTGNPVSRAFVELTGGRTALSVPLIKDGAVVGAILIYRREVRAFSEKQIALLENFAAQAVIAMENARLLDEIRQRQEELRITFENMGDGVAMFDETQHLVAWNRKFQDILDVPDEIIARRQTFSEYVRYLADRGEYDPEADPEEQVRRLIEQAGQARTYERAQPDGRVIEIRHNPVAGGGFVLIYADITERKHNEAEIRSARDAAEAASRTIEAAYRDLKAAQANLIQAEKMASLGQLTAGIAHEIKNPLNFVNNFAALSVDLLSELKETAAPGFAALTDGQRAEVDDVSAMLTSNLEKITEHGKRADGIVKAMLEHSRGSSAERRLVDLNAAIDEALNLAYHGARAQDQSFNITLERDFGQDMAPIEVNPQDMTRVFLNIFSNGFYAATRRARNGGDAGFVPTLKVSTRDAGEAVEIRVRDNGTGIAAEIRDKLFQPFFTTKPTGEGTGLGLSITYDIVTKQHGGAITVDSEVDAFTEFVVVLPRQMFANNDNRA